MGCVLFLTVARRRDEWQLFNRLLAGRNLKNRAIPGAVFQE
jgi:hypothetical protein